MGGSKRAKTDACDDNNVDDADFNRRLLDLLSVDNGPPQLIPDLSQVFAGNHSVPVTRSATKVEFKNGLEVDIHYSLWGSLPFGELQLQCTLFSDRGVYSAAEGPPHMGKPGVYMLLHSLNKIH